MRKQKTAFQAFFIYIFFSLGTPDMFLKQVFILSCGF